MDDWERWESRKRDIIDGYTRQTMGQRWRQTEFSEAFLYFLLPTFIQKNNVISKEDDEIILRIASKSRPYPTHFAIHGLVDVNKCNHARPKHAFDAIFGFLDIENEIIDIDTNYNLCSAQSYFRDCAFQRLSKTI